MEGLTPNEKNVWSCWETKTPRDVVREAASKGTHIPLAYRFLQYKQSWDEQTTKEWFHAEVFTWVLQLLSRNQYFKASHVLNKINISPNKHMFTVARESLDKSLRDYVIEQLIKNAVDLQNDVPNDWRIFLDHWHLLKLLEQSFGTVENKAFETGKDIIVISSTDLNSLTIEKIQEHSILWKNKIAAFLFLEKLDFSLSVFLEPESMWKILMHWNKALIIKRWITIFYSKELNLQNEYLITNIDKLKVDLNNLQSIEILQQLDSLFLNWKITEEMIEYVSECKCFEFTKLTVYDTLTAYGNVIKNDRNDLQMILNRLLRTQNLTNIESLISLATSTMNKPKFNNLVAEYCVKYNLFYVMTSCVDEKLLEKKSDLYEQNVQTNNCLDLWLLFNQTLLENDLLKYSSCIYETCRHLSGNVNQFVSENPLIVLSMLMLDKTKSLFDIFNDTEEIVFQNYVIKWDNSFKDKLPHLFSVYQNWKNKSLVVENDINIYQMLSGYKGLDISKVFAFQLNKCTKSKKIVPSNKSLRNPSYEDVNPQEEMPHFSNSQLVKKYGYRKQFDYVYYLKQNRPCMASQSLLNYQYQHFSRLNSKVINKACSLAHTLALEHWNDTIISACCISFIAMIGCDSIKCRTHIASANLILSYLEQSSGQSKDDCIKVVDGLMEQLIDNNSEVIIKICNLLQNAVNGVLMKSNEFSQISIGDILYEWQTVIRFYYIHNLPLPEKPLNSFIISNSWIPFLLFGDIFEYPQSTLFRLSQKFSNQALVEHIGHVVLHRELEEPSTRLSDKVKKRGQRRASRESSTETSSQTQTKKELDFSTMQDLWEVMAVCHGPDDPPQALIQASAVFQCPILALLATCYEPNAVDICWVQWIFSSLKTAKPKISTVQCDASELSLSDEEVKEIMVMCLNANYYKTLAESLSIFYSTSPLCIILDFLIKTVVNFNFGEECVKLLHSFEESCGRQASTARGLARFHTPRFVQSVSISLITIALSKGLKSHWHQKAFLQCLCEAKFGNNFTEWCPDWFKLSKMLTISLECKIPLNISSMFAEDINEKLHSYIDILLENKMYKEALNFANILNLSIDKIIVADWLERYSLYVIASIDKSDEEIEASNNKSILVFWTECSQDFLKHKVNPEISIEFLKEQCDKIPDCVTKFYILRLILGWFDRLDDNVNIKKCNIEFEMWMAYLSCNDVNKIRVTTSEDLYDHILNENGGLTNKDYELNSINNAAGIIFDRLLNEIEVKADISTMSITGEELSILEAERWEKGISQLLNAGLVIDAWRLSKIFTAPSDYHRQRFCPLLIVKTCLSLAEGLITPRELPQSLSMLLISKSNSWQFADKPEDYTDFASHLEDESLLILEALATRSGLKVLKLVVNYYKIALQIGWTYEQVIKFKGNVLDLINFVEEQNRMSMAKIILRTYDIPSNKIIEYICLEIVSSIISPQRTPNTNIEQKEHFHYNLWGCKLDSDFEMFLNLPPNDNSALGRMILIYLSAFRKCYKVNEGTSDCDIDLASDIKQQIDVILCTNIKITSLVKSNMKTLLMNTKLSTKEINIVSVELLVLAHQCFSTVCDTEGIATCLRSAQTLTSHLLASCSWRLMVRLLIGIARYTEMTYIFQILKDKGEFEFLLGQFNYMLGQNEDKINNFKQGILQYLKKHCPEDFMTYHIVAIHFSMYSEAADLKKKQANDLIVTLIQTGLDSMKALEVKISKEPEWIILNNDNTNNFLLESAITNCSEAAELYLTAGCLGAGREMAGLAQLLALQMSLLSKSSTKCILKLSQEKMITLIDTNLSFMEGLVFAHAVDVGSGGWIARWKKLVYKRFIRGGDSKFVTDIAKYRPDIAFYIMERYEKEKLQTRRAVEAMAELTSLFE